jgi:hypothetical protein
MDDYSSGRNAGRGKMPTERGKPCDAVPHPNVEIGNWIGERVLYEIDHLIPYSSNSDAVKRFSEQGGKQILTK